MTPAEVLPPAEAESTSVLIANRGEIAVRIVAACRRLGLSPVLAVRAGDRDSLAARLADRVLCIGPAPSAQSYLRPELLVQAAISSGAAVLHPGYGFCSEQPALAQACEDNGVAFAGPRPETLRALGDKTSARAAAQAAGVPISPGAEITGPADAVGVVREIGFPVLIKSVHGGGGRGIHLARDEAELTTRASRWSTRSPRRRTASTSSRRSYDSRSASPTGSRRSCRTRRCM